MAGKVYRYHYETFDDFLEACRKKPNFEALGIPEGHYKKLRSHQKERGFFWTDSFQDAENLALYGDMSALQRVKEMGERLGVELEGSYKEALTQYESVAGDIINLDAYLTNDPDNMYAFEYNITRGSKIVSLAVNTVCSAFVSAKTLMNKGSAVCILADILEKSGYRLEITMVQAIGQPYTYDDKNSDFITISALVKRPEQALDLTRVAYAIGHPDILRRHTFRFEEALSTEEIEKFGIGSGYGRCVDRPQDVNCDLYVGMSETQNFSDEEYCTDWVKRKLDEITKAAQ